jgi:cyclic dehypoxanthinyl futalosine synthase
VDIDEIASKVRSGERLEPEEALTLYRSGPMPLLGRLASEIRTRKHPGTVVTYIIDRNVNYTNVCVARCTFCAFYRPVGAADGYVLGFDELFRKIDETLAVGGEQLLLQGGHNPDLPLSWYEDLFRAIKDRYPAIRLHALSPPEILHLSRLSRVTISEVLDRLIAAGLDSVPGGGAEILVDRVRRLLHCYGKATSDEWLEVMRVAHTKGLRTTATMMFGSVETDEERIEHLRRVRALQDDTGGFTAFIAWSYQPSHTELGGAEATAIEYLRTLAVARIFLDNIQSIQASWVTQAGKVGQLSLAYGANDMGSVMLEENVVRAAGASYCMDEVEIVRNIEDAGFVAKRRNMHYEILGDPIFRVRNVPRMLELDVSRTGDTGSTPGELARYPARSRSGRAARGKAGA